MHGMGMNEPTSAGRQRCEGDLGRPGAVFEQRDLEDESAGREISRQLQDGT